MVITITNNAMLLKRLSVVSHKSKFSPKSIPTGLNKKRQKEQSFTQCPDTPLFTFQYAAYHVPIYGISDAEMPRFRT